MIKASFILSCLVLALAPPGAAWARTAPARAAAPLPPAIVRDVVYGHKAGMALTFDVLKPAHPNGAAIVDIISGGWRSQWAAPDGRVEAYRDMLDRGFTVMILYHGSQPQFSIPEATADVKHAVRYIRQHAAEFGLDPERLGVWGRSAGGQLALVAALMGDQGDPAATDPVLRAPLKVRTAVAYYPPSDVSLLVFPHLSEAQRASAEYAPELYRSISPVFFVDRADSPVLIIHGDADRLVDVSQSQRLHQVLDAAQVENRLIVLPGAGHGFSGQQADQARSAMLEWFSAHLAPKRGRAQSRR